MDIQKEIWRKKSESSDDFWSRADRLPRWRRWLFYKLAPEMPQTIVYVPPGTHLVSEPIVMGRGTILLGDNQ